MYHLVELWLIARAYRATVIRGRARALALLRRDTSACHRCKIARSEDRLRPLRSPIFLCSRGRVGARACVCVFMCSYVGPINIAINRADNGCK